MITLISLIAALALAAVPAGSQRRMSQIGG